MVMLHDPTFSCLGAIPECDEKAHGQLVPPVANRPTRYNIAVARKNIFTAFECLRQQSYNIQAQ